MTTDPDLNRLLSKAKKAVKLGKKFDTPSLIILMGLPGSGKSYISDYLYQKHGFTILSGENITYALYGTTNCTSDQYTFAYKTLRQLAADLLSQNFSIVIDGTNLRYTFRQQIYDEVICDSTKLIYLKTDDTTALDRVQNRGIDTNNPQNIKSKISPQTYDNFKNQLEEPIGSENAIVLLSDDSIFSQIDSLFNN